MVAVELEVLAKKFDRFGWERDRGTAVQDAMIRDWIEALVDFPLDEIRAACRSAVISFPSKMPNEGHVRAQIMEARRAKVAALPKHVPEPPRPKLTPDQLEARRKQAQEIMAGFAADKSVGRPA